MVQTPQQRRANEKFAKTNEKRMGKPETTLKKKDVQKSPVGPAVVAMLVFVVIAPMVFELFKLFPHLYDILMSALSKVGVVSR